MSYDTQTPYIASYILIRKGKKVAFVLRSNTGWMNNHYGLPSGKVEKGESYTEAAIREAKEEIGIDVDPDHMEMILIVHRLNAGDHAPEWVDVFFEVDKWKGEPFNAEPHVHSELAWLDPDDLPKNTIPAVSFALEQIKNGRLYAEYGWQEKA